MESLAYRGCPVIGVPRKRSPRVHLGGVSPSAYLTTHNLPNQHAHASVATAPETSKTPYFAVANYRTPSIGNTVQLSMTIPSRNSLVGLEKRLWTLQPRSTWSSPQQRGGTRNPSPAEHHRTRKRYHTKRHLIFIGTSAPAKPVESPKLLAQLVNIRPAPFNRPLVSTPDAYSYVFDSPFRIKFFTAT